MTVRVDRGTFVGGVAGAFASLALPARVTGATRPPILVILSQTGGCDMLNTLVPIADYGGYHDLRRAPKAPDDKKLVLAIPLAQLQRSAVAGGRFALHPAMQPLAGMYAQGKVAIVAGVGIPAEEPARLSHDGARFDWQTASIKSRVQRADGWIGRNLRTAPSSVLPASASLSGSLPLVLSGPDPGLTLSAPLENFSADIPGDDDEKQRRERLAEAIRRGSGTPGNGLFVDAHRRLTARVRRVSQIAEAVPATSYPEQKSEVGKQLREIARLIEGDSGMRVYFAEQDGYDTHAAQQYAHPGLVGDLAVAVRDFFAYLKQKGLGQNVVLVTMTDFGRRARGDANFGTDHGTASVAFAVGDRVRPGLYGEYPSLRRLDDDGNMQVPVDFRSPIADLAQYLSIDPGDIGGRRPLGFLQ